MCEQVKNQKSVELVQDHKRLAKKMKSPLYRRDNFLSTEADEGIFEVTMDQKRIVDNKPVHMGIAILQYSKLMLLEFVQFLRTYLKEGSYVLVYSGKLIQCILFLTLKLDTDSLTLATTRTRPITGTTRLEEMSNVFLPIVKEEKYEEFLQVWGRWLVLSNRIEEEKCPGKLKVEFSTRHGEMICLAPKSYFALCKDTSVTKDGRKGIPNWEKLKLDDFKNVLYNKVMQRHTTEVRSLRLDKDKRMSRTALIKKGLSGIHVKLSVDLDGVTCYPLQANGKII